MAYGIEQARNAVNNILKAKKGWHSATDDTTKNTYADSAKKYYDELQANGHETAASHLQNSDYEQAQKWADTYYATTGRTKTRPYFYGLGKSYGLSESDVDKLIGFDGTTGNISFGGKTIGKPDSIVDGVSYWGDTSVLDNAFNDYVSRSGLTRTNTDMVSQENENLLKKYKQEYDDLKNTNPFNTAEGRAIMGKYDLAGMQGRNNQLASGASSNGGNIDSFAAANAMRQQSALVNQGQMAVLEAHQQKLDHARNLLSDMGVHIDRVYNQDETSKNNEVARESEKNSMAIEQANASGYTPVEWQLKNDSFLSGFVDENGKLKEEYKNTDFQSLINYANERGDTATADKYAILRGLKFRDYWNDFKQYAAEGDVKYLDPQRTADYDLTKQKLDNDYNLGIDTNQASRDVANTNANANTQISKDNLEGIKDTNQKRLEGTKYAADSTERINLDSQDKYFKLGILSAQSNANDPSITDGIISVSTSSAWSDATLESKVKDGSDPNTGLDVYGADLIQKLRTAMVGHEAFNGFFDTTNEKQIGTFLDMVAHWSKECHVNADQLKKVFYYLGLDTTLVDTYFTDCTDSFYNGKETTTSSDGGAWSNGVNRNGVSYTHDGPHTKAQKDEGTTESWNG